MRFFNTVGPRQLGAYGMVVPRFINSALKNEPITVYGNGDQTRCFAHVYDVIDAVVATAFTQSTIGKVVNIGNNYEISINDLAKKLSLRRVRGVRLCMSLMKMHTGMDLKIWSGEFLILI